MRTPRGCVVRGNRRAKRDGRAPLRRATAYGHPDAHPTAERVTLTEIHEPEETDTGSVYFAAYFRQGLFGKAVRRSFWGKKADDGSINWERSSPEDLKPLVGSEVTGHVFIEGIDHAPKEVVIKATGESVTVTSTRIVRFSDETMAQARKRYGLSEAAEAHLSPLGVPSAPPGFALVGGDGQALSDS